MIKTYLSSLLSMLFFVSDAQNCTVNIIKFQPAGLCEGTTIQLIASPTAPGNSYAWNCPNSMYNTTTGPFLWIPYSCMADTGTYTLTVTDSSGCIATRQVHVTVVPKPIVYITGQGFACLGTKTSLYANDLSGSYGPYQFLWDNGKTTQSIKILHNGGAGPHPSCTMTNSSGCSASNQTAFMTGTLYPPEATISYSGLTTFCSPGNLTLTCSTPSSPQLTYQWKKNGSFLPASTAVTYKADATGNYKVVVTDINGCSDASDIVPVTVNPRPSATITASGPITFCNGDSVVLSVPSGSGYVYQWRKNGIPISGAVQVSFTAKSTGNYRVEVTSNLDCYRLSDKVSVLVDCREEHLLNNGMEPIVSVYPNPSAGFFTLAVSNQAVSLTQVVVFDCLGRQVEIFGIKKDDGALTFGSGLAPGVYVVHVETGEQINVIRLVKN